VKIEHEGLKIPSMTIGLSINTMKASLKLKKKLRKSWQGSLNKTKRVCGENFSS